MGANHDARSAHAHLSFEVARHQLERQEASLDDLRSRAGTLLTGNSLVIAFLGAKVIATDKAFNNSWTWIGTAAFVASMVLVIALLVPWFKWDFTLGPDEVDNAIVDEGNISKTYAALARKLNGCYSSNASKLSWLMWFFIGASVLLLLQACSWIVVLRT